MGSSKGGSDRYSGAMENLIQLSELMQQASALLADEDSEAGTPKSQTSFLTVVPLGNVSAGKSAVLNSLIGYPVLPTGENGATRVPIILEMERDKSGSSRGRLNVVLEGRAAAVSASDIRHSLQGRLKTVGSSKGGDTEGIRLVLHSGTAPPLKVIDIPGLDMRSSSGDSPVHTFAKNNDALLLLVIPASSCRDVAVSRALKLARDLDPDGSSGPTTTNGLEVENWRVAFEEAGTISSSPSSNRPVSSHKSLRTPSPLVNGHVPSRNGNHSNYEENGDAGNGGRQHTPARRPPPPPPPPGAPMYNY